MIGISQAIFKLFNNEDKDCLEELKEQYLELKAFKHDYNNILITLLEYIKEKDIEGLEEYFYKNIAPSNILNNSKVFKVGTLYNMKNKAIRGLILSKLGYAEKMNVNLEIDIPYEICDLYCNNVNITRCIGIILDNSIEAANLRLDDNLVKLIILSEKNNVRIIVLNKCDMNDIDKRNIFKGGWSTKGSNRGIGLWELKRLINSSANIMLQTEIMNNVFKQEITILSKGEIRENVKCIYM